MASPSNRSGSNLTTYFVVLERMAEKSASNLIKGILSSKEIPFERVLYAIGIRHVGETVAKKLATHFKSIDNLINANF